MQDIIINILLVSTSMSIATVLLLLFAKPLRRLKASCRYLLWFLVIVRLMIPIGVTMLPKLFVITTSNLTTQIQTVNTVSEGNAVSDIQTDTIVIPDPIYSSRGYSESFVEKITEVDRTSVSSEKESKRTDEEIQPQPEMEKATQLSYDGISLILLMVWLCGIGVFLTVTLSSYMRNIRIINRNLSVPSTDIQRIYRGVCRDMSVKRAPKLYICSAVRTPMVYGIFRQRVLLPDISLADSDIRRVLSHEIVHYKRHDLIVKLVALISNAVHWFNPLVYIASRKLSDEMELSCDERVLAQADKEERVFYGVAMLEIVKKCRRSAPSLTTGFNPRKKAVMQRFENILDTSGKRRGYSVIALLMCVCIMCTSIVGFAEEESKMTEKEGVVQESTETLNYEYLFSYQGEVDDIQPFYDMMDGSMKSLGISLLTAGGNKYIIDYNGEIRAELPESEFEFNYCSVCTYITDHNHYIAPESFEVIYEPSGHGGGSGYYIYDSENNIICRTEMGGYRICDDVSFAVASGAELVNSDIGVDEVIDIYEDTTGYFYPIDGGIVFNRDGYIPYDENYYRESSNFGIISDSVPVTDFDHESYLDFDAYGICALKKNGKWAYFNHKGDMILDYLYEDSDISLFGDHARNVPYQSSSGLIALKCDGKWGYADIHGNLITDFVFEEARPAAFGKAWVKQEGVWSVIAFTNYIDSFSSGEATDLVRPYIMDYYYTMPDLELRIIYEGETVYYASSCYYFNVEVLGEMIGQEMLSVMVSHDKSVYRCDPHYEGESVEIG